MRQNVKAFLERTTVATVERLIKKEDVRILDAKLPIVDGVQVRFFIEDGYCEKKFSFFLFSNFYNGIFVLLLFLMAKRGKP